MDLDQVVNGQDENHSSIDESKPQRPVREVLDIQG